jgi:hypothetical protein
VRQLIDVKAKPARHSVGSHDQEGRAHGAQATPPRLSTARIADVGSSDQFSNATPIKSFRRQISRHFRRCENYQTTVQKSAGVC